MRVLQQEKEREMGGGGFLKNGYSMKLNAADNFRHVLFMNTAYKKNVKIKGTGPNALQNS